MTATVTELFPFDKFRGKQNLVIEAAIKALYQNGYDNVVIDAPVGSGKSAINMTILKYGNSGFYTTPSVSLRQQLMNDDVLSEEFVGLRARADYTCGITGQNCRDCDINTSSEQSCAEQGPKCTYWSTKMSAIGSDISAITFSYLIIDNLLPVENNGVPISFDDRDGLVIDEAQDLITQTASLHAGFKITPHSLPYHVFQGAIQDADYDDSSYDDVKSDVDRIYKLCKNYIREVPLTEMSEEEKKCKKLIDKIEWMEEEIERDNPWVVDVDSTKYGNSYEKTLELRPVNVSSFLKNNVWSRAKKRVISTATLPYRSNPEIWLRKVGLDPEKTKVITVSMRFPVENRPIHTGTMVASMSGEGDKDNWSAIMDRLEELASNHYDENGLVHTSSYSRAQRVKEAVDKDKHPYLYENIIVHNQKADADNELEKWQNSERDIFLSPSMMQGVDLKEDMCRWQVLLKVPYPPMDSRTEYIVNNQKYGWLEYKERALIRTVQSYGRAVRSKSDTAEYYVLDKDFNKLVKNRTPPKWFTEAIDVREPNTDGVFDF